MNREEFSNQFDVLLNAYAVNAGFGTSDSLACNEYEKSVFLTQSEEEFVLSLYTGKNPSGSFESTEELRRYLSNLVVDAEITPDITTNGNPLGVDSNSKFFTLPDNPPVWFIVYEHVELGDSDNICDKDKKLDVYPVKHDEYLKLKKNPFRGANDRRALRLDLSEGVVEIVSSYTNVNKYYLRYIRKPRPILLINLKNEGLSIEGEDTIDDTKPCCELHESLHQRILEMAVMMALKTKASGKEK